MLRSAVLRWLPAVLAIGAVAAVLPVFLLCIYNHPCAADDFQNAAWHSYAAIQRDLYLHWSGRYFNNAAATLCPLHWHSFAAYRLAVFLMMCGFAAAYAALIARIVRALTQAPARIAWSIAALLTALLFNNFPSLSEGFFWFSGAATYVLPATAALLMMRLLIRVHQYDGGSGRPLVTSCLLAAAAIGGNETMLVLCGAVAGCGWLYYRAAGTEWQRRFYARLLTVCAVCAAIAILAPGNFARQAVHPHNGWLVLPTWIFHSVSVFIQWLYEPYLLTASTLVLLLLWRFPLKARPLNLPAIFLLPLCGMLLLGLPAHYALGNIPPPRVMNMLYTFFVAGWLVFLLHLAHWLRAMAAGLGAHWAALRQGGFITLIVLLLSLFNMDALRRGNLFTVCKSWVKGMPQSYDAEMQARYACILSAPGDTVGVPPVRHQAGNVLYTGDIISLKRARTNAYYGVYFGKRSVFIDTAAGNKD